MSREEFDRFRDLVTGDSCLRAKLRACAVEEELIETCLVAARGRGFLVERDDVRAALDAGARGWVEGRLGGW
jgi:predicted ribosomally synthesized peptide with nif11-like leader